MILILSYGIYFKPSIIYLPPVTTFFPRPRATASVMLSRDTQHTPTDSPSSNARALSLPAPAPRNGPEQDPLATWTAPPADESPDEYTARQKAEADAKKQSELIDEDIKAQRTRLKREKRELVKVLLVGQSESGKSTILKSAFLRSRV